MAGAEDIPISDAAPSNADPHTPAANGIKEEPLKASASLQLASILVLLEKAVKVKDTKLLVGRLLRQTAAVRKQLTPDVLNTFLEEALPAHHPTRSFLLEQLTKVSNLLRGEPAASLCTL